MKKQRHRQQAGIVPGQHGRLTYHKPLSALTPAEARNWMRDLQARLGYKMERERAFLDRCAALGMHTPTDEAYQADHLLESEIMDLLETIEQQIEKEEPHGSM